MASPSDQTRDVTDLPGLTGQPGVVRLLDANRNRAREALRVLEDAARFLIEDATACAALKALRHDLRAAMDRLPPGLLEANRDTAGDPGTRVSTALECRRADAIDVVTAAAGRLGEALRTIEEWAKTIDAGLAGAIEAIRYRAYDLERDLLARFATGRAEQWPVCVLLTEALCLRSWTDVLDEAISAGAACVQVREKDFTTRALVARIRAVIERARPAGIAVIVNDRVDVALITDADGVHLGTDDLSIADARRLAGRSLLIGASTHDLSEARAAVLAGADYCGVGAMYATSVKPDRAPAGPPALRAYLERHGRVPHLAIGGITPDNIEDLVGAGCAGVAVSRSVCGADAPGAVVAEFVRALSATRTTVTT